MSTESTTDEKTNTFPRSANGRFERGVSGNLKGRPKGSRNKFKSLASAMLDEKGELIVEKVVELAMEGDPAALQMCWKAGMGTPRTDPVAFDLPPIETLEDAKKASNRVLEQCAAGELSLPEAGQILALISSHGEILKSADIAQQIKRLQEEMAPMIEKYYHDKYSGRI